jgi:rhomboid protease GluP
MELLRSILTLLEKAGVNTTRLKWKLFQWEKRSERMRGESFLPARLHWLRWRHKTCFHCGALVDRTETACPKCGARVPSIVAYRLRRLLGAVVPQNAPVTVMVFLVAMWLVFAATMAMQGTSALASPTSLSLEVFGAWSPAWILRRHEYWRYMTFGIMHIGLLHIGFNTYALLQVGPVVENMVGKVRMLVIVTVTQLTSASATYAWYHIVEGNDHTLTAGASGWLFGVIGFGIAALWFQVGAARAYRDVLVRWALYALVFGLVIGANNAAHVGGLLGGLALGVIPERGVRSTRVANQVWTAAAVVSTVLWVLSCSYLFLSILTHWTPGGTIAPEFLIL